MGADDPWKAGRPPPSPGDNDATLLCEVDGAGIANTWPERLLADWLALAADGPIPGAAKVLAAPLGVEEPRMLVAREFRADVTPPPPPVAPPVEAVSPLILE